jgi:Zn finger protein HypA/HybF involved in hydrogenase expression
MKSLRTFSLIFLSVFLANCKKNEDTKYHLQGRVYNGRTGNPLSDVFVEVEQQILDGNSFSAVYVSAASGRTNGEGSYDLEWDRENLVEVRVNADKGQFIPRTLQLDASSFEPGKVIFQNIELFPEAFIKIAIQKNTSLTNNASFNIRFENANFDCFCCDNNWESFTTTTPDTSKTCRVYGDTWLKYRYEIIKSSGQDELVRDSIYCPSNIQTNVSIEW